MQDTTDYQGPLLELLKESFEISKEPQFKGMAGSESYLTDTAFLLLDAKLIDESNLSNGRCTTLIYRLLQDEPTLRKAYVAELASLGENSAQALQDLVECGYTAELTQDKELLGKALKGNKLEPSFKGKLLDAAVTEIARMPDGNRKPKQGAMSQVLTLAMENSCLDQLSESSRHSIRSAFNLADVPKRGDFDTAHIDALKKAQSGLTELGKSLQGEKLDHVKNWLLSFPRKNFTGSDGMVLDEQKPLVGDICRILNSMTFGLDNGQDGALHATLKKEPSFEKLHPAFQYSINQLITSKIPPRDISKALQDEIATRERGARAERIASDLFKEHKEVQSVAESRSFSGPDKVGCDLRVELSNGRVLHVDIKSSQHTLDQKSRAREGFLEKNELRIPLAITSSNKGFHIFAASEFLLIDPTEGEEIEEQNRDRVDRFVKSHLTP